MIENDKGVLVVSLTEVAEHIGEEGELEDHLDDGVEGVAGETHVVHETIPVPALSIQDEVNQLLPEVPERSENRDSTHVAHDAFEHGLVEETHHKPHKAHWREKLHLSQVPFAVEGDIPIAVEHNVEDHCADAMDHAIHAVVVHGLAVGLVSNETTYVVFELTTAITSVHLCVFAHTY